MMAEITTDEKYKKAARAIIKAGGTPLPISDTLLEILKHIIEEDELDFVMAFKRKASQTMEQLKESSNLPEEEILKKAESLAKKGVIFNQPSSKGIMVYRLLPFVNVGIFEYQFMKKLEFSEEEKELAGLFDRLFDELKQSFGSNREAILKLKETLPPVDRTIPFKDNLATGKEIRVEVNESIEVPEETIIPAQDIGKLIEKFDDITVAYCFCRHHKDLSGEPCKQTDLRETCFTFGKSARHVMQQGFGRRVSREEALEIMRRAEEDGLIHKAFHPNFDITKDEVSVCNCCKCCCANSLERAIAPIVNTNNYVASVDQSICIGCGTCVEKCPMGAIELNADNTAEREEEKCIGCGICAHFCPENAISLLEGQRIVRVAPPGIET